MNESTRKRPFQRACDISLIPSRWESPAPFAAQAVYYRKPQSKDNQTAIKQLTRLWASRRETDQSHYSCRRSCIPITNRCGGDWLADRIACCWQRCVPIINRCAADVHVLQAVAHPAHEKIGTHPSPSAGISFTMAYEFVQLRSPNISLPPRWDADNAHACRSLHAVGGRSPSMENAPRMCWTWYTSPW